MELRNFLYENSVKPDNPMVGYQANKVEGKEFHKHAKINLTNHKRNMHFSIILIDYYVLSIDELRIDCFFQLGKLLRVNYLVFQEELLSHHWRMSFFW